MPTFREVVESGTKDDGYEPQLLWLVPVFYTSRIQYYDYAVNNIHKQIERQWRNIGQQYYATREDFEKSSVVRLIWDSGTPFWWGLNDIVGWLDVRACVRKHEIQVALFLPQKHISRNLKEKVYVVRRKEQLRFSEQSSNFELQEGIIQIIVTMKSDSRVNKRYMDYAHWFRLIKHTDIKGVIREAEDEDMDRILKNSPPKAG